MTPRAAPPRASRSGPCAVDQALIVTGTDPARIRAFGFIGVMTVDMVHQAHHLALATRQNLYVHRDRPGRQAVRLRYDRMRLRRAVRSLMGDVLKRGMCIHGSNENNGLGWRRLSFRPIPSAISPCESVIPIRLRPDFSVVFGGYAGGAEFWPRRHDTESGLWAFVL